MATKTGRGAKQPHFNGQDGAVGDFLPARNGALLFSKGIVSKMGPDHILCDVPSTFPADPSNRLFIVSVGS